jgi:hypothetical protein
MPKKYGMRIINTYDEAYQTGRKFIDNMNTSKHASTNETKLPTQIADSKWEMSVQALENTLRYIFELLHHQCYMMCINGNNVLMCKLEMPDTAPIFREIIEANTTEESLMANPNITGQQLKYIKEQVGKNINNMRVMQCVVKPFAKSTAVEKNNEYLELVRGLDLPDGVFILNLTDAVILRNDGKSPFTMVTGKIDLGEYNFDKHVPILSLSGQRNYLDIPIPNYDDVMYVLKTPNRFKDGKPDPNLITAWDYKKYDIAVFRGGPTGCGYTDLTNMRIKLAQMKSPLLDAKLSAKAGTETIDTKSIRFDPKYGLGMLNTSIRTSSNFLNMKEQSNYKYIIHIDGNVNAYRLLTTMTTGSLILRVTSQYTSWVDHLLQHKVHYVPVKADLSDLLDVVRWCRQNDDRCREIASNGMKLAQSILSKKYIQTYFQKVLFSVTASAIAPVPASAPVPVKKSTKKSSSTRKSSPKVKSRAKTMKVRMTKEERQAEKDRKDAEKQAEKEKKEADKLAEKQRKEAEKQAEKERKEAEKKAEKEKKEADKLAEKERKETEKRLEKERKEAEKLAKKAGK